MSGPTLIKTANDGVVTDPDKALDAMRAILADAWAWGMLGVDLEWDKLGRITWIGFGTSKRAYAFWLPTLPPEALKLANEAMADPKLVKLGHNGIQADRMMWEKNLGPCSGMDTWQDTMLLHHAAFPGLSHELQQVVSQFLVVPPWKAWRAEANKRAKTEAKEKFKLEKDIEKAKAREAKVAEAARIKAEKAAEKERIKAEKKAAHEARNAERAAEKARKKAEKQRRHEEHNAKLKAEKEARKAANRASAVGAPHGFRSGQSTSQAAFEDVMDSGRVAKMQEMVFNLLDRNPDGLTRSEIDEALKAPGEVNPSYHKRLSELERAGKVWKCEKRSCGVTGRTVYVWRTEQHAKAAAEAVQPPAAPQPPAQPAVDPRQTAFQMHPRCSVCSRKQWMTPGGVSCDGGHGGADPSPAPEGLELMTPPRHPDYDKMLEHYQNAPPAAPAECAHTNTKLHGPVGMECTDCGARCIRDSQGNYGEWFEPPPAPPQEERSNDDDASDGF